MFILNNRLSLTQLNASFLFVGAEVWTQLVIWSPFYRVVNLQNWGRVEYLYIKTFYGSCNKNIRCIFISFLNKLTQFAITHVLAGMQHEWVDVKCWHQTITHALTAMQHRWVDMKCWHQTNTYTCSHNASMGGWTQNADTKQSCTHLRECSAGGWRRNANTKLSFVFPQAYDDLGGLKSGAGIGELHAHSQRYDIWRAKCRHAICEN